MGFQNKDVHLVRESEDRIEIEVDSHSFSPPKEWNTGNLRSAYYFSEKSFGLPFYSRREKIETKIRGRKLGFERVRY